MYDEIRLCAMHEAGHLLIADFLGLTAHAIVRDDGSGETRVFSGLSNEAPEDVVCFTVAGRVGEAMAIDGNLKRAVSELLYSGSGDEWKGLVLAIEPLWRSHVRGRNGVALDAAQAAAAIIRQNRPKFDRLVRTLYEDRIARVGPAPAPKPKPALTDVRKPALPGGDRSRPMGIAELRGAATKAEEAGHDRLARLLRREIAAKEGRETPLLVERGTIGGGAFISEVI